jgi:hypothetical protein
VRSVELGEIRAFKLPDLTDVESIDGPSIQ